MLKLVSYYDLSLDSWIQWKDKQVNIIQYNLQIYLFIPSQYVFILHSIEHNLFHNQRNIINRKVKKVIIMR